jgi:hypothetical protein
MIAAEINMRDPKIRRGSPAMEIRFHFADGSKELFIQSDAKAAAALQRRMSESNLFN